MCPPLSTVLKCRSSILNERHTWSPWWYSTCAPQSCKGPNIWQGAKDEKSTKIVDRNRMLTSLTSISDVEVLGYTYKLKTSDWYIHYNIHFLHKFATNVAVMTHVLVCSQYSMNYILLLCNLFYNDKRSYFLNSNTYICNVAIINGLNETSPVGWMICCAIFINK